ncbi:MAG: S8 family peptidase [Thermoplasmata archaeon]|nr:S8 family peptidase [Thermoplasmata archaeon]
MADQDKLYHIPIQREEIERPLRGHAFPGAPRVRPRDDRPAHGDKISEEIHQTIRDITQKRDQLGITPDRLRVLEFEVLSVNQRELLIRNFGIAVVEELQDKVEGVDHYRLLVQFPASESLNAFEKELELYRINSEEKALLPLAQRRDLFDALDQVARLGPEDRKGPRLKRKGTPAKDRFYVDLDLWYDGTDTGYRETEEMIRAVLSKTEGRLISDLFRIPSLLLGKAKINAQALEHLLQLDFVSTIDLPVEPVHEEAFDLFSGPPDVEPSLPGEDVPLACIVDSGVFSGHPLLRKGMILEERDLGSGEENEADLNGHGTGVAGIVVYGDVARAMVTQEWEPKVRICSAKVLKNDPVWNNPVFPEEVRPESVLEEAIRYFHQERHCRIFNLSVGDSDKLYRGGRQFSWAEMLDNLSRELDIIIVVSAGNVHNPEIPNGNSREEIQESARDQLLNSKHRLIDPGTAAICLSVGSIARREDPYDSSGGAMPRLAVSRKKAPSVFTRTGFGVAKALKPDLVAHGGNYALQQIPGGDKTWVPNDPNMGELTLRNSLKDGRWFKAFCGTSLAAPHVTHIAALIEHALKQQLGDSPSANLIRAMMVNSANVPENIVEWLRNSQDINDNREKPRKQEYLLRLVGFGEPQDDICWSHRNRVTLFAEDTLPLKSFHIYSVRIPPDFLQRRGHKKIAISLAYDPPVRLSRKDYIATRVFFEVYKGLTSYQLEDFRRAKERGEDIELPLVPEDAKTNFTPGYQVVQNSTVQLRTWEKGAKGGADLFNTDFHSRFNRHISSCPDDS